MSRPQARFVAFLALLLSALLVSSVECRSEKQDWLNVLRSERDFNNLLGLFKRQENTVDPACNFVCEIDSCGNACPSKRSLQPLEKRYNVFNDSSQAWNFVSHAQYLEYTSSLRLDKRTFNEAPRWNKRRIGQYIVGQLQYDPPQDTQFPSTAGFFDGSTMGTLSQNDRLNKNVIQYGTGSLHGCSMVAVVSNRAVWMAHFWEGYAFRDSARPAGDQDSAEGKWLPDDNITPGSTSLQRFQNAAMNLLDSSVGTKDPNTSGNRIDWRLFNKEGDNTQVMFMTPAARNGGSGLRYPQKIGELERILKEKLPNAKFREKKVYQPLNWVSNRGVPTPGLGDDAELVDTNERGQCLFQYDGAGNWRLFFEEMYYSSQD